MCKGTHFYSPGPALSVTSSLFITCISVKGQSGHKGSKQAGVGVEFKSGVEGDLLAAFAGYIS